MSGLLRRLAPSNQFLLRTLGPSGPTSGLGLAPAALVSAARWNRDRGEKSKALPARKRAPRITPAESPAALAAAGDGPAPAPRGIKLPSEMPSTWVLQQLTFRHPREHFYPTLKDYVWRKPRISLRNQARIRKAALLCGIDPVKDLGLPEKENNHGVRIIVMPEGKGDIKKFQRCVKDRHVWFYWQTGTFSRDFADTRRSKSKWRRCPSSSPTGERYVDKGLLQLSIC